LEIKFYIFFLIFLLFLDRYKIADLTISTPFNTSDSSPMLKIAKKIKNIKFDLQRYFNMKIMFNDLNWLFRLLNLRYGHKIKKFVIRKAP
jgi:hypothetical protein